MEKGYLPQTGFYITESGERIEIESEKNSFYSQHFPYLNQMNITKIVLPQNACLLWCYFNKLTTLHLPKEIKIVRCDMMDCIEEQYKRNLRMYIYQKK